MTALTPLVQYLDDFLDIGEVPDYSRALNGLQVENAGQVERLVAAVDACQASIDYTARQRSSLLLVHHGLFWGGLEPLTGRHGRRVRSLVEADLALYSAHLPLDCHPEVGNNAVLARRLEVEVEGRFGEYEGLPVGVYGRIGCSLAELGSRLERSLGCAPHVLVGGPTHIERVGIVTGGAGDMIRDAVALGLDAFITGEGQHHTFFDAEELGINVFYAGHYATETVGVKALAEKVATKFDLAWEFFDHPTGL